MFDFQAREAVITRPMSSNLRVALGLTPRRAGNLAIRLNETVERFLGVIDNRSIQRWLRYVLR